MPTPSTKNTSQHQQKSKDNAMRAIRNLYLYMVALIGLITFILGSVGIINNVLQHYVFQVDNLGYSPSQIYPNYQDQCSQSYADPKDLNGKTLIYPTTQQINDCRTAQAAQDKKLNESNFFRDISVSIAQIVIGFPIWLFHWGVIQKDYKKEEENL